MDIDIYMHCECLYLKANILQNNNPVSGFNIYVENNKYHNYYIRNTNYNLLIL